MEKVTRSCNLNFLAKPISTTICKRFYTELTSPKTKSVDIFCHTSADEDTINSAKVFYNWLTSLGKKVNICVEGNECERLYFDSKKYKIKNNREIADKILILDFNSTERVNNMTRNLLSRIVTRQILGLDHHSCDDTKITGDFYIDSGAKSCCSIVSRFFEALGIPLGKEDRKSLYCGMISDYEKSGCVKINKNDDEYSIKINDKLLEDNYALEAYNKIANSLSDIDKQEVLNHMDTLSRLNSDEVELQKRIFSSINLSPDKKIAYIVIEPNDKLWEKVGMDNKVTSSIMKDFRIRVLKNKSSDLLLKSSGKDLKDVNTVITFYRKSSDSNEYRMSIHSKKDSALDLIYKAQKINKNIVAGGHRDRAGGKIESLDKEDIAKFVSAMTQ